MLRSKIKKYILQIDQSQTEIRNQTNYKLEIKNVTSSQSGTYKCTLTSDTGETVSTQADVTAQGIYYHICDHKFKAYCSQLKQYLEFKFKLVVETPVPPQFSQTLETVHVAESETIRLETKFEGKPEPQVQWSKDGQKLDETL